MSVSEIIVEADLDDDGVFETTIPATDVKAMGDLTYGRTDALSKPGPRMLRGLLLDNQSGDYSPLNASSPHNAGAKDWTIEKRIRVLAQVPVVAMTTINDQHSFESDVTGAYQKSGTPTIASDTTTAKYGGEGCRRPR